MPVIKHKDDNKIKGGIQKKLFAKALKIEEKETDYLGFNFYSNEEEKALFEANPLDENIKGNDFKNKTLEFKERYKNGESLDSLLIEAYALVCVASNKYLHLNPYKVQMMGGIAIHEGNIAEMKTGEGKTLTAVMPAYLNALTGKGVHIVTVNEYLAAREANGEIGRLFNALGLTVGLNVREKMIPEKREAYNCDILYTTNNEIGFDYLRDNMAVEKEGQVQRGLNFVIVDEVDSILIDEARTPLIISGKPKETQNIYLEADTFVKSLSDEDYEIDIKTKVINITQSGIEKAEKWFNIENLYDIENLERLHTIENALRANYIMQIGVDYVVRDVGEGQDVHKEVLIVDQFTGRLMIGRQFSEGLHQALEAKESKRGVEIKKEMTTLATITFQNFFRMYNKLAGMTGTAKTEEEEFLSIYNMRVIEIPTNSPVARIDANDKLFITEEAKFEALIKEIKLRHEFGQPILVGTISVEVSEYIAKRLEKEGFTKNQFSVLNAKHQEKEARIVEKAGQYGAITIATNMAGRGTDIKLQKDSVPNEKGEVFDVTNNSYKKDEKVSELEPQVKKIEDEYDFINKYKGQLIKQRLFIDNDELEKELKEAKSPRKSEKSQVLEEEIKAFLDAQAAYALYRKENKKALDLQKREKDLYIQAKKVSDKIIIYLFNKEAEYHVKNDEYLSYKNLEGLDGLAILGTERHESRRIDNQLRGRSGRQGDPGYSCFFISAEDDLLKRFGSERFKTLIKQALTLQGYSEKDSLNIGMFSSSILRAQKQIEGNNFDMRKSVLQYDEVMKQQREVIYSQRQNIIECESLEEIEEMLNDINRQALSVYVDDAPSYEKDSEVDSDRLFSLLDKRIFPEHTLNKDKLRGTRNDVIEYLSKLSENILKAKKVTSKQFLEAQKLYSNEENFDKVMLTHYKACMLESVDLNWMEHIDAMAGLRQSVSMSSYAQQNPLREYQMQGLEMFNSMSTSIKDGMLRSTLMGPIKLRITQNMKAQATNAGDDSLNAKRKFNPAMAKAQNKEKKPDRNDPCWCGSGKKYKDCHMRQDIIDKKWN